MAAPAARTRPPLWFENFEQRWEAVLLEADAHKIDMEAVFLRNLPPDVDTSLVQRSNRRRKHYLLIPGIIDAMRAAAAGAGDGSDPETDLVQTLAGVGRRHERYGVTSDMFAGVGVALLGTLCEVLGPAWAAGDAPAEWVAAYNRLTDLLLAGYENKRPAPRLSLSPSLPVSPVVSRAASPSPSPAASPTAAAAAAARGVAAAIAAGATPGRAATSQGRTAAALAALASPPPSPPAPRRSLPARRTSLSLVAGDPAEPRLPLLQHDFCRHAAAALAARRDSATGLPQQQQRPAAAAPLSSVPPPLRMGGLAGGASVRLLARSPPSDEEDPLEVQIEEGVGTHVAPPSTSSPRQLLSKHASAPVYNAAGVPVAVKGDENAVVVAAAAAAAGDPQQQLTRIPSWQEEVADNFNYIKQQRGSAQLLSGTKPLRTRRCALMARDSDRSRFEIMVPPCTGADGDRSRDDFGIKFYDNLFEVHPELRPLFDTVDMVVLHSKLLSSIALCVEGLRDPASLKPSLVELGRRHVGYGAMEEQLRYVGVALLRTLMEMSGETWSTAKRDGWEKAIGAVTGMMIEGLHSVAVPGSPEAAHTRGAALKKFFYDASSTAALTAASSHDLKATGGGDWGDDDDEPPPPLTPLQRVKYVIVLVWTLTLRAVAHALMKIPIAVYFLAAVTLILAEGALEKHLSIWSNLVNVIGYLEGMAVIITVVMWFKEGRISCSNIVMWCKEAEGRNSAYVFSLWSAIDGAEGNVRSRPRIYALQTLNEMRIAMDDLVLDTYMMRGINMCGASMLRCVLNKMRIAMDDLVLDAYKMRGINMCGASMLRCSMRRATCFQSQFIGATLAHADLTGADFSASNLNGATLSFANLSGAKLCGADLRGSKLVCADLTGANMSGADLTDARVGGAVFKQGFTGANMSGADLTDARVGGAVFKQTFLGGAKLRGTELTRRELEKNGCTVVGAIFDEDFEEADKDK
ncbi:hypothetical protein JKP88DRAFT_315121 [Tribonema minus]|uniref:Globin domain-containing protein n=1 Tax=Tribonema minus TaxID=303371 RepID=A0A835Z183_9STRA|nr:hypothetical protein JKP88DRAFT_315121 [Tribonema minus]